MRTVPSCPTMRRNTTENNAFSCPTELLVKPRQQDRERAEISLPRMEHDVAFVQVAFLFLELVSMASGSLPTGVSLELGSTTGFRARLVKAVD